jgi:ferrous iron transport protein B
MFLSELKSGDSAVITRVRGRGAFRRRIMEMGFIRGRQVKVIKNAPLKDPIEYSLIDYRVSLRRSESRLIEVEPEDGEKEPVKHVGIKESISEKKERTFKGRTIEVAFVGNPNAGKTSLFNHVSSSHEHTGNYSGVTVDSKTAELSYNGYLIKVTDLPGTYSLSTISPEELFVREYITNQMPDVVVNVVDASNLERNLYLTTQIIDMDIKVVLALNMFDELEKREDKLDTNMLGNLLGMPIVPTVGSKGKGIQELLQKIIDVFNDIDTIHRHIHINFGDEVEASINSIQKLIKIPENYTVTDQVSSRFVAVKLLENDRHVVEYLSNSVNLPDIINLAEKERIRLELLMDEDISSIQTGKRYGFISGALMETYHKSQKEQIKTTEIIDSFLTHKLFGFIFFIFFMWILFTATFKIGEFPKRWLEQVIHFTGTWINSSLPEGSLKDMFIHGIIGGVGGVIVFLPNILILFLLISFMEDSGYMARAVFIMDKLMHKIGLHGKSFIPLIMGFGCNVPAIMATRTIEDKNNRLLTMLINPFMSCSARLPVYLLLIGAVFPEHQGTMLFLLYIIGIGIAILVAVLFRRILFRSKGTPFVMELPPYRMPTARSTFKHMWYKGSQYLKKMGGVILIASILLWALGYFPRTTIQKVIIESNTGALTPDSDINQISGITNELQSSSFDQTKLDTAVPLENSYIGRIGRFIEPVMRPLGFDWKMGVSLISGILAKEVVVSTLGVLYRADNDNDSNSENLAMKIKEEVYSSGNRKGKLIFNPLATISFLLFVLIYFPCIAVFAAVKNESGNIWWAIFMIFYTTLLAYIVSLTIYQAGKLLFL